MQMIEKTMEEKPTNMMMGNQFFGAIDEKKEEMHKECSVVGLLKNFINDIDEKMEAADKNFSRAYHKERYSQATYEADENWKMLNAQKEILNKAVKTIENMLIPSTSMTV